MNNKKLIITTFATLLLIAILGYLGILGVSLFNSYKVKLSNKMLIQSQKDPDLKKKIILLEQANLLNETDQTRFYLARSADQAGNVELAKKTLERISKPIILIDWAEYTGRTEDKVLYMYKTLNINYPQVAGKFLKEEDSSTKLSKEGYLLLGQDYFSTGEYILSEKSLLKARDIDQYNPQVYEQLVKVEQKLGNKEKETEYLQFLNLITFK